MTINDTVTSIVKYSLVLFPYLTYQLFQIFKNNDLFLFKQDKLQSLC